MGGHYVFAERRKFRHIPEPAALLQTRTIPFAHARAKRQRDVAHVFRFLFGPRARRRRAHDESRVELCRAVSSAPSREDARAETREEHEDADDDDTDEHGRVSVETRHSARVRRRPAKHARVLAKMFRLVSYGVDAFASGERGVCEEEDDECERERHCDGEWSHAPMASSRDLCASSALAWARTISASASRGVMEWSGVRVLYTWKLQARRRHDETSRPSARVVVDDFLTFPIGIAVGLDVFFHRVNLCVVRKTCVEWSVSRVDRGAATTIRVLGIGGTLMSPSS